MFRGSLQSRLTCQKCGHESIKNDPFLDLSLSLNHFTAACALPAQVVHPTSNSTSAFEARVEDQKPNIQGTLLEIESDGATQMNAHSVPTKRGRGRPARVKKEAAAGAEAVKSVGRADLVSPGEMDTTTCDAAGSLSGEAAVEEPNLGPARGMGVDLLPELSETARLTLSDCLRSFTTLEKLGEKIVSVYFAVCLVAMFDMLTY